MVSESIGEEQRAKREIEEISEKEKAVWGVRGKRYGVFLFAVALAGWALASYDYNLLVLALPNVAHALNLTSVQVGLLGTVISLVAIFVPIILGGMMDSYGRKKIWMLALLVAALSTGFTALVQNYYELAIVRILASSFGLSELGISITIVNESVGPKLRGWIYSWVQGGWPLGVFLASAVYLIFIPYGFRVVFLVGVIPLLVVVVGRYYIKDPVRFENLKKLRGLLKQGVPTEKIKQEEDYRVDLQEAQKFSLSQVFATKGYVRTQLIKVMLAWFFYASSWMLTNVFISYFLTQFYGWSATRVAILLLISGGIGYFFYPLGGYFGEKIGRRNVLFITAALTPIFAVMFLVSIKYVLLASIIYFFLYQWTNGTWSGAGYAYWGESFPTRVRGTIMGFLTGWFNFSTFVGGLIFSALVGVVSPSTLWMIMAVGLSIGELTILMGKNIKPGQLLEDISI